ncbi:MAG TPA: hypothetical protein VM223_27195 [Planctomycetota bacterium]|nr:hypothetical protein [Planctomycetota bacterium]
MADQEYRIVRASATEWIAGTVAAPAALAGYPTSGVSKMVETINMFEGAGDIGQMQRAHSKPGSRYREAEVSTYLYASATDAPPVVGALLRACAFSENLGGTTPNIAYTYILASQHLLTDTTAGALDPVDVVLKTDQLKSVVDDAVGSVSIIWKPNSPPVATFKFRGLAETADATAAFSTYVPGNVPVAWQNAAITIAIAGAGAIADLVYGFIKFDSDNVIDPREDGNGTYGFSAPRLAGRMPTLEFQVEATLLATLNLYTVQSAGSLVELKWQHNAAGGVGATMKHGFRGYITKITPGPLNGKLAYTVLLEQSGVSTDGFYMGWKSTAEYTYPF